MKSSWKVKINGKGSSFIAMEPMSEIAVWQYLSRRWPGYEIEVMY